MDICISNVCTENKEKKSVNFGDGMTIDTEKVQNFVVELVAINVRSVVSVRIRVY